MSQWRDTLHMLENATGGWITTHDIYDELDIKNPSQRIDDIERLTGRRVEREQIVIKGKRATRYRLAVQAASALVPGRDDRVVEQAPPAAPAGTLFDAPAAPAPRFWEDAA